MERRGGRAASERVSKLPTSRQLMEAHESSTAVMIGLDVRLWRLASGFSKLSHADTKVRRS
jgi:hypothetical protein